VRKRIVLIVTRPKITEATYGIVKVGVTDDYLDAYQDQGAEIFPLGEADDDCPEMALFLASYGISSGALLALRTAAEARGERVQPEPEPVEEASGP
jgi:hypothetical protein